MESSRNISKYKLWVIGLYVILFPLFVAFTPNALRYHFSSTNLGQVLFTIAATLLGFYLLNLVFGFHKIKRQNPGFSQILLVTLYAVLFAVPEEIIFRGIVQTILQNANGVVMAVLVSSIIFGLAHLPNGASGLHPSGWNWGFAAVTFLAGLPLGFIFAITGSLLIPTLLHAFLIIFFYLFVNENQNIQKV